jgi:hypothetical protein
MVFALPKYPSGTKAPCTPGFSSCKSSFDMQASSIDFLNICRAPNNIGSIRAGTKFFFFRSRITPEIRVSRNREKALLDFAAVK